ncbi:glycosyltransferase family 31 protein [Suillus paluster]|uniref:glycosyltransferase family 31 protein n=1 Tax=Suillus paluster TaxID=48578 RepID=UPI001B869E90|nr:glycosyltransferase family 31 protein [Suillus paluster]KAG1749964.1 glycosyltransferase family 31 protein [Suillus paluster]
MSGRLSSDSSSSTPTPSRAPSPTPFSRHSSSPSETETDSPLLGLGRYTSLREGRWNWRNLGSSSLRRRKRDGRKWRAFKGGLRRIVRHPLFPRQPLTIIIALLMFTVFAISLTLALLYILNPDKEALPWRAYCTITPTTSVPPHYRTALPYPYINPLPKVMPPSFPPDDLDALPPAGLFLAVFSMDSSLERRMLIRTTWAAHPRSRNGAGEGDDGMGTSRTLVRFVLGQPRKGWERRIQTEMEMYNDIIILPCPENMNSGKSHAYFTWAASNAWVPPVYFNTTHPVPEFSYSDQHAPAPRLAPHDPYLAWKDSASGHPRAWVRPDYVAKVDDDAFVMLAELEARMRLELYAIGQRPYGMPYTSTPSEYLRVEMPKVESQTGPPDDTLASTMVEQEMQRDESANDPLVYWGYLVKEKFMAGELYGLSWSLVDWVSKDPGVKALTKGAEDKQTARWMTLHPRAGEIRWSSDHCWIYDHPRSGTVYSHGFLFPSEVSRVKKPVLAYLDKVSRNSSTGAISLSNPATGTSSMLLSWAHSSVSTFGTRYQQPLQEMDLAHSVEALVEGSDMSKLQEGISMDIERAWRNREGRVTRYENKRVGGTVVVHFIKKHMWFLETALAFLESDNFSEAELEGLDADEDKLNVGLSSVWTDNSVFKQTNASAAL